MKKLFLVLAAMLVAASSYAQFGVLAGLTSSETNLSDAVQTVGKVNNFHLGVAYKFDLGIFAIQPEVIYNVKGATDVATIGSEGLNSAQISFKTGYLEIPVQLQAGVKFGSLLRLYAFAEPFAGYAVTNEQSVETSDSSTKDWTKTWDNIKSRAEYGLSLGAGAEVLERVQVSVKYFWNLGNIYGGDISFDDIKKKVTEGKCSGIAASVAIFF